MQCPPIGIWQRGSIRISKYAEHTTHSEPWLQLLTVNLGDLLYRNDGREIRYIDGACDAHFPGRIRSWIPSLYICAILARPQFKTVLHSTCVSLPVIANNTGSQAVSSHLHCNETKLKISTFHSNRFFPDIAVHSMQKEEVNYFSPREVYVQYALDDFFIK